MRRIVKPPDIVLIGCEWRERALLRAQLLEEGYDVVALDAWPMPREYRRPGMKPRILVVDLHGLPNPRETLDDVRFVMPPARVLVVTALGTLAKDDLQRLGFRVVERPVTVGEIVSAVAPLLTRPAASQPTGGSALAPSSTKLGRVDMRKQDRIAQSEQQNGSKPESQSKQRKSGSEPRPGEDMKGSGSPMSRPPQHPREPGKLPLPD
jgi:hypothetical protein